ncbi:TIGR00266 family protein [Candidatus Woesearchaeota archaeon]|nr:TIGR00266 family protein [Candidatus Woesearchaeota archaeon]
MKYKVDGTVMQVLNLELKTGEKVYSERGGMTWMSDNIKMETSTKGGLWKGFKRMFSGESFFLTTFTCETGTGVITFGSEVPGKILPIQIKPGKEYICQKDAFLCAENTVVLDIYFKKRLGAGFFGGEGFILQKLSGKGEAFINIDGEVTEVNLKPGQVLKVDTGHLAMYEPTVEYDIEVVKGVKNILFGGEGFFFAVLRGPGKVWLQSLPARKLAGRLAKYYAQRRGSKVGTALDFIGGG